MITCDVILLAWRRPSIEVLLIQRKHDPCNGHWALPGGFVDEQEPLEKAALRELQEETGIRQARVAQLATFGKPGRDPRGRTVTVVYYALVRSGRARRARAGDDASDVAWFPIAHLPRRIAFDHRDILAAARMRLRDEVVRTDAAFRLLPAHFTLEELQRLLESALGRKLDAGAFRRGVRTSGIVRRDGAAYRVDRPRLERALAETVLFRS